MATSNASECSSATLLRLVSDEVLVADRFRSRVGRGASHQLVVESPTIAFIRCGTAEVRIGRRRIVLDPSQVLLLNAGDEFSIEPITDHGEPCLTTITLTPSAVEELGVELDLSIPGARPFIRPLLSGSIDFSYKLHVLIALTSGPKSFDTTSWELAADCARVVFLLALQRSFVSGVRSPRSCLDLSDLARRAREVLIHRATGKVSLDSIAEAVGVSRFHVCRVFATEVGTTMREYLHTVRISEALFQLAEGESDLTALALDLGYSSHSHFTSVFRRLVGLPPSRVWARVRRGGGEAPWWLREGWAGESSQGLVSQEALGG